MIIVFQRNRSQFVFGCNVRLLRFGFTPASGGSGPPPVVAVSEWLVRARRRGRR